MPGLRLRDGLRMPRAGLGTGMRMPRLRLGAGLGMPRAGMRAGLRMPRTRLGMRAIMGPIVWSVVGAGLGIPRTGLRAGAVVMSRAVLVAGAIMISGAVVVAGTGARVISGAAGSIVIARAVIISMSVVIPWRLRCCDIMDYLSRNMADVQTAVGFHLFHHRAQIAWILAGAVEGNCLSRGIVSVTYKRHRGDESAFTGFIHTLFSFLLFIPAQTVHVRFMLFSTLKV